MAGPPQSADREAASSKRFRCCSLPLSYFVIGVELERLNGFKRGGFFFRFFADRVDELLDQALFAGADCEVHAARLGRLVDRFGPLARHRAVESEQDFMAFEFSKRLRRSRPRRQIRGLRIRAFGTKTQFGLHLVSKLVSSDRRRRRREQCVDAPFARGAGA